MQSEMRRAPSRVEDWLNVTRNSIRNSFMRIASQARAEDDREITEVTPGRGERAGVPRCPQEKARLQGAAAPLNKGLGPFSPVHWQVNVVLPVCGDKDDTHLDELERVVLQDWGHCLPRCNKRSIHCSLEV